MPSGRRSKKSRKEEAASQVKPLINPENVGDAFAGVSISQDKAAEQAVLGACLMDREAVRRAVGMLTETDFYPPQHRLIWRAIEELHRLDKPCDLITVSSQLRLMPSQNGAADGLEAAGSISYLVALSDASPTPSAVRHYGEAVRKQTIRRDWGACCLSFLTQPDDEHVAALMESLEKGSAGGIDLVTAQELLVEDVKVEWLIRDMIPLGSVTVLAGDSGAGKSSVALSLAHAYVHGYDWLGKFRLPKGGGVLYVDCEAGRPLMKERLQDLDIGTGLQTLLGEVEVSDWEEPQEQPDQPALYFCFDPPDLQIGNRIFALEPIIRQHRIRLLVLDSLEELSGRFDLNRNDDMLQGLRPLERLARRTGCCIILIHHMRKRQALADNSASARVLGAQAIRAATGASLGLTTRGTDEIRVLETIKVRAAKWPERPFVVKMDSNSDGNGTLFLHGGPPPDRAATVRAEARQTILELLADRQQHSKSEIVGHVRENMGVDGPSSRSIERLLGVMDGEGEIVRSGDTNRVRYEIPTMIPGG